MTIEFRPAVRENVGVLIALAGASGSGKTYSALRLAKGLAQGRPIAFIDTEARRGLHYADQFQFLHADLLPPFRPERFVEAIRAGERAGAAVIIVDSTSHEYDGEGGIMDWADELAANGIKSPGNWKEPKLAHKRFMNVALQCRASLIFCLRADEKIEIVREGGRTQVRPLGWMPICEKRFMYEMTASFTLTPDAPGRPRFDLPHKLQQQHRGIFPEGEPIGEAAGEALARWARGEVIGQPGAPALDVAALAAEADEAADRGTDAYAAFWGRLSKDEKRALLADHDARKARAAAASQAPANDDDFPGDRPSADARNATPAP